MDHGSGKACAPLSPPWFAPGLLGLTIAGIALRIVYAVVWQDGRALSGDPRFYEKVATEIYRGHGYSLPSLGRGAPVPTALHPPLFSTVLAFFDALGLRSPDDHRIALAFVEMCIRDSHTVVGVNADMVARADALPRQVVGQLVCLLYTSSDATTTW